MLHGLVGSQTESVRAAGFRKEDQFGHMQLSRFSGTGIRPFRSMVISFQVKEIISLLAKNLFNRLPLLSN